MTIQIACAYIGLLALARLRPEMAWIFWATAVCVGLLAFIFCVAFMAADMVEGF